MEFEKDDERWWEVRGEGESLGPNPQKKSLLFSEFGRNYFRSIVVMLLL